jgi:hypothetical protein
MLKQGDATMSSTGAKSDFMSPKDLKALAADKANREIDKDLELRKKREEEAPSCRAASIPTCKSG